jgi:hypothetical protein
VGTEVAQVKFDMIGAFEQLREAMGGRVSMSVKAKTSVSPDLVLTVTFALNGAEQQLNIVIPKNDIETAGHELLNTNWNMVLEELREMRIKRT